MTRISKKFQEQRKNGRKTFIAYVTAGVPDAAGTVAAIAALEQGGADIVEIGIPFSDPMADGPIIQAAANMALQGGMNTGKALEIVKEVRKTSQIPLAVMTYVNTILSRGVERFISEFAAAGLDGLIVPDVPLEEAGLLAECCAKAGVDLIQFVAPTTTPERLKAICKQAGGFIYCISNTGVTGVRDVDYGPIGAVMNKVRGLTDVPLAIGFGIGTPDSACLAARFGDGVIVGSAIVRLLMEEGVQALKPFAGSIRQALDKGV